MMKIPLSQGKHMLIDDEDCLLINNHKWHVLRGRHTFYAVRNIRVNAKHRAIYAHRVLLGLNYGDDHEVDHINHNGLDNRRGNLRIVNRRKNQWNRLPHNKKSSKYKGVSWSKDRRKWLTQCQVNGRYYNLGRFIHEDDAALAYNHFAKVCFGEYAKLNDIPLRNLEGR